MKFQVFIVVLVFEAFVLEENVQMVENVVVSGRQVWRVWWMRHEFVAQLIPSLQGRLYAHPMVTLLPLSNFSQLIQISSSFNISSSANTQIICEFVLTRAFSCSFSMATYYLNFEHPIFILKFLESVLQHIFVYCSFTKCPVNVTTHLLCFVTQFKIIKENYVQMLIVNVKI